VILGTAAYMAPEQARGGALDKRADIWAFGVVLYEMLAGERLFAEGSVVDTLSAVMRKEIDLGKLSPTTPRRLRELVRRCLERDPKRRLRDIGEARIALDAIAAGEIGEEPAAEPEAVAPRERLALALRIGVVLAALAVGALLGIALAPRGQRVAAAEPIRIHALTYSGSDSEPAASPDGKLLAFTSRRDGVSRIWLRQLVGGGEAPLTDGPDGLARFSPDGSSILFVRDLGSSQAVYRTGLIGGEPRRLVENATAADWSPDGARIVFVRTRDNGRAVAQLRTLDVATGQEKSLADLTDQGDLLLHSPRWSPDGRSIALASGTFSSADWKLRTVDVASGKVSVVPPGTADSAMGGIAWSGAGGSLFYVQSPGVMGDIAGSGSRVIRCDLPSGSRQTLFWRDGLSWLNSSISEISQLDVLAPGRLILGQRMRSQNLREVARVGSGAPPASRLLAIGSAIDRQPIYSPDGAEIFFSSNRGGNLDLWTIDRQTRALRQITDDPAEDWDPAYMPGGRQIVWSSSRESGHLEIWLANADGSGARQVSTDGVSAQNPEPTPDGSWIVYWSGNPEKLGIWKVHPDGSGSTLLQRAVAPSLSGVSPDGRYAYWVEQDRLNLRNTVRFLAVESGEIVASKIDVHYTLGAPAILWGRTRWAPDGRSIYFVGENEQGLSGIYEQQFAPDRDMTATRRPVGGFSPEYVTESFGVSPDGSHLALSTGQESSAILVAEGVEGALPPIRKAPS